MKLLLLALMLSTSAFSGIKKIKKSSLQKSALLGNCDLRDLRHELVYDHRLKDIDADLVVKHFDQHVKEMLRAGVAPEGGIYSIDDIEDFERDLRYNTNLTSREIKSYITSVRYSQLLSEALRIRVKNRNCTGEDL